MCDIMDFNLVLITTLNTIITGLCHAVVFLNVNVIFMLLVCHAHQFLGAILTQNKSSKSFAYLLF